MRVIRRLSRSRLAWAAVILGALVGLYALLGFYLAPRLVRNAAIDYVKENYGRDLRIGTVRIQPFKLQAEVDDLALPDADGQPMLGFRRLFIDFELSSLWHRAFVFKDVTLDAPALRAVLHPDGSLNLAALASHEAPETAEESPPPSVWIQSFKLSAGVIDLLNQMRRVPVQRHFAPVAFELTDFKTTREGGQFAFAARSPQDERFEWKGRFALAPQVTSSGTFAVHALQVPGALEFEGSPLPFDVPRGHVDLAGAYDVTFADKVALNVSLPTVNVTDIALRARGVHEDWVEIPALTVSGTKFALLARTVTIDAIELTHPHARLWMAADGSLNLDQLLGTGPPAAADATTAPATEAELARAHSPEPGGATAATATTPSSSDDLTLRVGRISLQTAALEFEDRTVKPTAAFALTPLNVTIRDATLDLAKPLPVEFDAAINGEAKIKGSGQLVPEPLTASFDVDVARFAMRDLQPYLNGSTDMTIRAGTVDAHGKFALGPGGTGTPKLQFAGDVTLDGFHSIDNALEQDFVKFERVELSRLRYAMTPDALAIDSVRVATPFARVIVSSDGILNAAAVFDPKGTAAAAAAARAQRAAQQAESTRKKTRAELKAEKQAAAAAAKARAQARPVAAAELKETGMPIRIREVVVSRGTMDFADFSVQPHFAAAVQSLGGRVTGLSSDPNSHATVKLTGNVGEFSPVHIDGTVQPFAYDRYTDIGLRFENISLPIFNPYSGRFAGYNIAKGKLTTDLHYQIVGRKLNAQHHVRIDQLEWGEATASKGEATLPVKFATSLLKDADGVINLDVPVAGTLDDPSFRIGPIVWQVIKNLLTKVVTAPFKALGALFKGAEDAQFVDFAPGMATLEPAATERLAALGKSLVPKADLRLEIPVGVEPKSDGQALANARYERGLAAAMDSALNGKRKRKPQETPPPLPAFDTLEPERKIDVLSALYQSLSGAAPVIPEPEKPTGDVSRKEAKTQAERATVAWLEAECRKRSTVEPDELDRLAQARAEAIQHAVLTDTGLEPTRVFTARNGKVTPNAPNVRFELSVK